MSSLVGQARAGGSELTPQVHVYEPHRAGLPPLRPYFREV